MQACILGNWRGFFWRGFFARVCAHPAPRPLIFTTHGNVCAALPDYLGSGAFTILHISTEHHTMYESVTGRRFAKERALRL
jgi:hypothetical protein